MGYTSPKTRVEAHNVSGRSKDPITGKSNV